MLKLRIPDSEYFDSNTEEFKTIKGVEVKLEHSLISLSKWESKWKIPFLDGKTEKTNEMLLDYINCMCLTQNVDPEVFRHMPGEMYKEITEYINDSQTATWFSEETQKEWARTNGRNNSVITSEVLYYLMVACQIPFDCEKWHLSRLITLIRVYQEKNKEPKKMSQAELLSRNRKLNEARRRALNSKG